MKPVIQTGLIAAASGVLTAGLVCLGFYWFAPIYGPDGEAESLHQARVYHGPPKSVSPPLVLPPQATPVLPPLATDKPEELAPLLVDLPSFSPLVRRVIPAVVNISIMDEEPPAKAPAPVPHKHKDHSAEGEDANSAAAPAGKGHHKNKQHHAESPSGHHGGSGHGGSHGSAHHPSLHHSSAVHPVQREVRPVDDETSGAGSGFIIDATGIIVTNRHVVGDAAHISVALSDGRILKAHLIGDDPMTDIAVIKVKSDSPLPWVSWGDSRRVEIGDWILVAGNPFGFGSSVTAGIVSAVGRDLGIGALDNFMQLDAPINPGNSGGPAFNLRGEVVAVNAAIASPSDGSVGIGFGIPAEIVAGVVADIIHTGHVEHGWLGVTLNDSTTPMWVEDVDPQGAAWKGGLRKGDELLAMGDVPVHDARTVLRSVAAAHPGTVYNFTIRRQGVIRTLAITLGKHPMTD